MRFDRRFLLVRHDDVSGVSGNGVVASGVEFADGRVALRWRSATASTNCHESIDDVVAVHGHGGLTVVRWLDAES